MGQIPTAERSQGLLLARVPQATGEGVQRDERAQAAVSAEVQQTNDVMAKVLSAQETNAAQVFATEQLTNLKDMAAQDPDFKNTDKYAKELARIGGDAAKTISSPVSRDAFATQYALSSNTALEGIKTTFRDRQLKAAHADLLTGVDAQKEAYYGATFPQDKLLATALIKKSIQDNVNGLVISPEDGVKMWQQIEKDLPEGDASRDIGKNPVTALQRLQANTYGIKDEGKRAQLIKDAQQASIREKKMADLGFQKAQEQTAVDLTMKLWDGSLTDSQIKDEMAAGVIDRKDAEHLHNALFSERTSDIQSLNVKQREAADKVHAATYMAMWDTILKKGKATDKRRTILKELADGNLRREDAQKLYTGFLIPAAGGGKVSLAEEVSAEESQRNHFIAGAIQMFRKFFNQNSAALDDGSDNEN